MKKNIFYTMILIFSVGKLFSGPTVVAEVRIEHVGIAGSGDLWIYLDQEIPGGTAGQTCSKDQLLAVSGHPDRDRILSIALTAQTTGQIVLVQTPEHCSKGKRELTADDDSYFIMKKHAN